MKINIFTRIKKGAWGGGNQFLKALKTELIKKRQYTELSECPDAVIFNSYKDLCPLFKYFFKKRGKIVYRLGPIFYLHRGLKWKIVDILVVMAANLLADIVIFQSDWSYKQAVKLGFSSRKKFKIIINAVDGSVFSKRDGGRDGGRKIRLIYTSWSMNQNKGFGYLDFLDKNLDFNKYELIFIGNSPLAFKNIKMLKPLPSADLARELRLSDIFISPAKDDACSNAILEALACGLPVVFLKSGSNSELVGEAGLQFENNQDLMDSIRKVSEGIDYYRSKIVVGNIESVCEEYVLAIK